jgi:hypothetical protein
MKTIVISDVHQRVDAVKSILEAEKNYDEVVFLGDWFDSFFDPPKVAGMEETAEYLRYLVMDHPHKSKFVFLVGNHDVSYIFNNRASSMTSIHKAIDFYCSGFTISKAKKFRKVFYDEGLKDDFFHKNFKVVHQTQGWTLSHAGLHERHVPVGKDIDVVVNEIIPHVWKNFRDFTIPHHWLLSGAGRYRGGDCAVGGVIWLDWNVEFEASEHIGRQIVGHTTMTLPEVIHMNTVKESWNLDTEKDYGVIINGMMTTKPISLPAQKKYNLNKNVLQVSQDTLKWD